ncbi:fucolectin-like [Lycodopsis pacificus]
MIGWIRFHRDAYKEHGNCSGFRCLEAFFFSLNHPTVGDSRIMKLSVLVLLLLLETRSAYTYENVALRGKATQSDRWENALSAAYNAIDGNRNAIYSAGSCTHTITMTNPWWRVDMLDSYIITSIVIVNRVDCCAERLNGAEIHVGNSLNNPVVGTIPRAGPGESVTLTFTERVEGRYVIVALPGENRVLTLCEVEVYGYRAPTGVL